MFGNITRCIIIIIIPSGQTLLPYRLYIYDSSYALMVDDILDHSSPQPVKPSIIPMAEPIAATEIPSEQPTPAFPIEEIPEVTGPNIPFPFPQPWHICRINLTEGCYRITYTPSSGFIIPRYIYHGTLRVQNSGGSRLVSGDLYKFWNLVVQPLPPLATLAGKSTEETASLDPSFHFPHIPPLSPLPYGIPIYARRQYYSYLKVTGISISPLFTTRPCQLTFTIDEYVYTPPPAGSFDGTFPTTPTRSITVVLFPRAAPFGFTGSYFEGRVYEGGVDKGSFTMGWVSPSFRRATVQVSCVPNAVAPTAVPAISGSGTEDIRTVFASAGWDVNVIYDSSPIAIPPTTTTLVPGVCPTASDLHALMASTVHTSAVHYTHLDQDWRIHLLVVPGDMGCGRGVMFDTIDVPREAVGSFCDDGYPTSQSSNFGTAADRMQREVLRAFLRSACHEVGHGFQMVHQENEAGADNSIMTTTPSVANVLGGPTTGAPGVFPDNINLAFNDHVRHHLIHLPDIVVRPGGMTFPTGHTTASIPETDEGRFFFPPDILELRITTEPDKIKLGEPLHVAIDLVNNSEQPIPTPSDIDTRRQHTFISVTDPNGNVKVIRSYVIQTETVTIKDLKPKAKLHTNATIFWSINGFAFQTPGKHLVEVRVVWSVTGQVPYGVKASVPVWVNFPISEEDNEVASLLMHEDVGKFVALGGDAKHLKEAVSRIETAISKHRRHSACKRFEDMGGHKYSKTLKKKVSKEKHSHK
jgi:hypothetical protein